LREKDEVIKAHKKKTVEGLKVVKETEAKRRAAATLIPSPSPERTTDV
jgi:hypothetical protein